VYEYEYALSSVVCGAGISAELYYVRNGVVNECALSFVLPVKTDVDIIYFDWQSLRHRPLDSQVLVITGQLKVLYSC